MTILVYISIKFFFLTSQARVFPIILLFGAQCGSYNILHTRQAETLLFRVRSSSGTVRSTDWTTGNLLFLDPTLNTLENAMDCTPKWGTQYPMSRCPLLPCFSLRGRGLQYIDFLPCWKKWYDMLLAFGPLEVSLRYPSLHLHGLIFYLQSMFLNRDIGVWYSLITRFWSYP